MTETRENFFLHTFASLWAQTYKKATSIMKPAAFYLCKSLSTLFLLQGCGLLGIYGCALLHEAGFNKVFCYDINPERLAMVSKFGGIPLVAGNKPGSWALFVQSLLGALMFYWHLQNLPEFHQAPLWPSMPNQWSFYWLTCCLKFFLTHSGHSSLLQNKLLCRVLRVSKFPHLK